jgi:hypothetical protein
MSIALFQTNLSIKESARNSKTLDNKPKLPMPILIAIEIARTSGRRRFRDDAQTNT